MTMRKVVAGVLALTVAGLVQAAEKPMSNEELTRIIEQQQRQLDELRKQVQANQQNLEATAEAVEKTQGSGTGFGATKIGGYGELHYNGGKADQIDFHRFVLFFGHEFSDDVRLFSELELEHAYSGDGEPGEVELEQAYVEMDLTENHRAKAGLFLVPVGILNETHEPPTFYGVERNPIEHNVLLSTWWEGGVGLSGQIAPGVSYDFAVHSGLALSSATGSLRGGRKKVAEAPAENFASTGRIRYTAVPGLELGATLQYQQDVTQNNDDIDNSAVLIETHAVLNRGPFGLRALYAQWNIDGSDFAAAGTDTQRGWYIEPSFKFTPKVGVFARYNAWDNKAGDGADSEKTQIDTGVNFWPHQNVVLKADYQWQNDQAGDDDRLNLGVGYQF